MPVKSKPICTLEPQKSLGIKASTMVKKRTCHIHKKTSSKKNLTFDFRGNKRLHTKENVTMLLGSATNI